MHQCIIRKAMGTCSYTFLKVCNNWNCQNISPKLSDNIHTFESAFLEGVKKFKSASLSAQAQHTIPSIASFCNQSSVRCYHVYSFIVQELLYFLLNYKILYIFVLPNYFIEKIYLCSTIRRFGCVFEGFLFHDYT